MPVGGTAFYGGMVPATKIYAGATLVWSAVPPPTPDILTEYFDVDISDLTTHTLTDDVGSLSSAFVQMLSGGSHSSGSGRIGTTANLPANNACGVALTATDTLTFYTGPNTQKAMGQVWRYIGAAAGNYEFINRGSFAVSFTTSDSSISIPVSSIVDVDKCVPILNGVKNASTSVSDWEGATFAVHMDASDNLVVSRNNTALAATVYVTVVEFTGSAWSVGHAVSSNHDTADEVVTLNTACDGVSGSTFDVVDWETAFIVASLEGDTNETGIADIRALAIPEVATTQVKCYINSVDGTARNDGDAWIHVVKCNDMVVKREFNNNYPEGNNTYTTVSRPVGAAIVPVNQQALEWFVSSSGTGTAHMRGSSGAVITGTQEISSWVHRSGNSVHISYGVINLSGLVTE
jgi:hypothetical protein